MLTDIEKRIFGLGYIMSLRQSLIMFNNMPKQEADKEMHFAGMNVFKLLKVSDDMDMEKYHEILDFAHEFDKEVRNAL